LGIPRVIVPLTPGVLSAFGLLVANIEHDHASSYTRSTAAADPDEIDRAFRGLDRLGRQDMQRDRVPPGQVRLRRFADMRYLGQSYELEVELIGELDAGVVPRLVEGFHQAHQRTYRQNNPQGQVEIVNLRTVHYAPMPRPSL